MTNNGLTVGPWTIAQLKAGEVGLPKNRIKVFSCFHCGGGSSFGYKLAGFDVLGGVEIDPQMMKIYRANHDPKYSFLMGVQQFNKIKPHQLPEDLFNLDILDGSPPCSSFSMAGSREKKWTVKKKFREGQAEQVLDDLFFHFIQTAKKLNPKVVIAENVKGLIQGNAKGYVKQIFQKFDQVGYDTQLFLLNASRMGVPQKRERTFFVARRRDLQLPQLKLEFNERVITVGEAFQGLENQTGKLLEPSVLGSRQWCRDHNTDEVVEWTKATQGKEKYFTKKLVLPDQASKTLTASTRHIHYDHDRYLSNAECIRLQAFPEDYDSQGLDIGYVCGMSVPPFMTQRISNQIHEQLLKKNF